MALHDSKGVIEVLKDLAEHGWVPLRSMSALLNYSTSRGVYQRQRGNSPIETIKVGGTYRVYALAVVETLQGVSGARKASADVVLDLYRTILEQRDKENKDE